GRPSIIVVHMTRVGLPDYGRRAHERHADNRMVLIVRSAYVVTECYIDYCDLDIYKRVLRKPPARSFPTTGRPHRSTPPSRAPSGTPPRSPERTCGVGPTVASRSKASTITRVGSRTDGLLSKGCLSALHPDWAACARPRYARQTEIIYRGL